MNSLKSVKWSLCFLAGFLLNIRAAVAADLPSPQAVASTYLREISSENWGAVVTCLSSQDHETIRKLFLPVLRKHSHTASGQGLIKQFFGNEVRIEHVEAFSLEKFSEGPIRLIAMPPEGPLSLDFKNGKAVASTPESDGAIWVVMSIPRTWEGKALPSLAQVIMTVTQGGVPKVSVASEVALFAQQLDEALTRSEAKK